jgi:hypothetical protein
MRLASTDESYQRDLLQCLPYGKEEGGEEDGGTQDHCEEGDSQGGRDAQTRPDAQDGPALVGTGRGAHP